MKLSNIARVLGFDALKEDFEIKGISSLKDASESDLSFLDSPKYVKELEHTKAKAIILKKEHEKSAPKGVITLISENPYLDIALISKLFAKPQISDRGKEPRISRSANIMPNVFIGKNSVIEADVTIMSGAFIGENCRVGKGSIIYPNVVIYSGTKVGKECIVHAGAVLGSDGFGYAHTKDGKHIKIHHLGSLEIGDSVEIGANSTIDRAVFGKTIIKDGVKIDNLVQIAHNCVIGEYSIIAAQSGLSGSTTTGRNVMMGGQCGTAGHLHIGDFAMVGAKSGVHSDLEGKKAYSGYPVLEQRDFLRLHKKLLRLLREDSSNAK